MPLSSGESISVWRMDYWRERFSLEGGWWKGFWIEDSPALPAVILPAGLVAGVNLYAWLDSSV